MRAAALIVSLTAGAAGAYCPCYTLSSTNNTYNCGIEAANGTNPTVAQWQSIFALVSKGPSAWGTAGPSVQNIGQGCGKPQPTVQVPARFPCEVLKTIAMQESSWRQFCVPDTPGDQVGGPSRTIISFDCGYGIGQVTSGMHVGENPGFDRARVASDATYNLATGTRILASKWAATNCVGDNQPSIIEDWYSAVWAYNGLAYKNNPNNPTYSSNRGVYNPAVNPAAPYQEKVFGRAEYPPSAAHWTPTALAYPNPVQIGGGTAPPSLDEPSCASPTNCVATRAVHTSACFGGGGSDAGTDAGTKPDAGIDAGTKPDAGSTPDSGATPDSGTPAPDAGTPTPDAGTTGGVIIIEQPPAAEQQEPASGCGCTSAAGLGWLALIAALLRRRR